MSIVFHGHDHFYAKQDLAGIVYQEVPQPGNQAGSRIPRYAADYGYKRGTFLGGSGHLRVAVSEAKVTVDFLTSVLPGDETPGRRNAMASYSWSLPVLR